MKKILSVILALLMLLSLASCGKRKVKIQVPKNKQIAILLTSEEQYPEDALAAKELEAKYPGKIVIKQLGDSRLLNPGEPEIVTAAKEAAQDEKIGAIIFDRATQFTDSAISEAKAINPGLFIAAIEPEREYIELSGKADLQLLTDWASYAKDIVSTAKKQGAEYFVFFSIPAHVDNELYLTAQINIESSCKEQGIEYIYSEGVDPIYSGGIKGAQDTVKENLEKLLEDGSVKGENIALFSTDSSVQSALVKLADEKGYIYIAPSFPSAYNGVCEVFKTDIPEDYKDTGSYIKALKEAVKDSKGRFSAVNYPMASVLLTAAVYTSFDMVISPSKIDDYYGYMDSAVERVLDAANDKDFSAKQMENLIGEVLCYKSAIEILK